MISIVIPVRNEESVIEKTLLKLREIKNLEYEIIVSDGNSTDKTVEICNKYADKVIEATEKQKTIAAGKNAGVAIARGEFVLFIDADIIIPEPERVIREVLATMEKDPQVFGITVSLRVFPEMETFMDYMVFGAVNWVHYFRNNWFHSGSASGEFQFVRHEAFKKIGGFEEKFAVGEDNVMFWRLSQIGKTRMLKHIGVYHTGRRAHIIGWPKLLYQWLSNSYFLAFKGRSKMNEWEPIR
jgi:glycosyltransferase involved in cell wall biosynthesis